VALGMGHGACVVCPWHHYQISLSTGERLYQAGGSLRTSTRPTLNLLLLLIIRTTVLIMIIHPEGKPRQAKASHGESCSGFRPRLECVFALTLPPGHEPQGGEVQVHSLKTRVESAYGFSF
jgi:hypothetical protein